MNFPGGSEVFNIKALFRASLASALGLTFILTVAPASHADDGSNLPEGWYLITDQGRVAIPEGAHLPESSTPAGTGEVTTNLIAFDQWAACYTFNNANTVFATYQWHWNGAANTKNLMCGTSSWGYKHIEARHKTDWQNKLNVVQAAGYGSGITWDDVMAAGISAGISYPDYVRQQSSSNKFCVVGALGFYTSQGALIQNFNAVTSFASDSTRVITSYPTGSSSC